MMKKLLILAMVLTSILYVSCTKSEESDEDKLGSIYGIVTELGTAEPMKAVGVELYKKGASSSKDALLLKTVTFDDGHFEFKDLNPENYQVKVVADGYEQIEEGYVAVEAGRQARIDLQVNRNKTYITVHTFTNDDRYFRQTNSNYDYWEGTYKIEPGYTSYEKVKPYEVGFVYGTQSNPKNGGKFKEVDNRDISEKPSYTYFYYTFHAPEKNVTYYYQAYVKNQYGTSYGEVCSVEILP